MANERKGLKTAIKERAASVREKASDIAEAAADKGDEVKNQLVDVRKGIAVNVKKGGRFAVAKVEDFKEDIDEKRYNPVSRDRFLAEDFQVPKLIWLMDSDPHPNIEACRDAVGYMPRIGKMRILKLIKGEVSDQKLSFYPNLNESIYYRNPYEKDLYVNLDEYFDYIKKKRVNELVDIASKLGAKYVKIVFKEEKKAFVSLDGKKKTKEKAKGAGGEEEAIELKASAKDLQELEVACEMEFTGHNNPETPELIYYKNDPDIESLVQLCMDKANPPKSKSYTLKYNRKQDINLDAAIKIDFVLSKLSMAASASVKSEVEKENRMYMEYQIKF